MTFPMMSAKVSYDSSSPAQTPMIFSCGQSMPGLMHFANVMPRPVRRPFSLLHRPGAFVKTLATIVAFSERSGMASGACPVGKPGGSARPRPGSMAYTRGALGASAPDSRASSSRTSREHPTISEFMLSMSGASWLGLESSTTPYGPCPQRACSATRAHSSPNPGREASRGSRSTTDPRTPRLHGQAVRYPNLALLANLYPDFHCPSRWPTAQAKRP
mmetsp:Transcript_52006/g.148433  ORF Transcript_52006/g.148433 Transcript_52006/m.148433 type:complete len:217 (-) Transcript_52006:512-1162(-)